MPKKCPPGVICIENMTLVFIILIVGYLFYLNIYIPLQKKTSSNTIIHNDNTTPVTVERETKFINVPVTVNTQRMEYTYRQVGILTRVNTSEVILPLQGRMVNTSRDKWQYFTINDSNNAVRLPISVNGKNAMDEYGVDELYSGDTVYVQGYNDIFKVTIYENNRYAYIPF
tara:strand:+ start:800 stop:1312 length:513 start_codon:yes stop_codon:yes gene_type:complete